MISVVFAEAQTGDPDISVIKWSDMTPWSASPITVHITIPGGNGLGKTYLKGRDNAVTTLTGRVRWTPEGEKAFDALAGRRLKVLSGVSARTGTCTAVTVTGTNGGAWIAFTCSITED